MKTKDRIIIKDNFFNEKVLKKIHNEISNLNFTNRSVTVNKNDNNIYQKIYFNVELKTEHFAVQEVYKNLRIYFKNKKKLGKGAHFYFLSTKHKEQTAHKDSNDVNCLVYLKGNHLINSGTGFYDYVKNEDKYVLNTHVGFKENRAIIFDPNIFHSSLQFNDNCGTRYSMTNFFNYESIT